MKLIKLPCVFMSTQAPDRAVPCTTGDTPVLGEKLRELVKGITSAYYAHSIDTCNPSLVTRPFCKCNILYMYVDRNYIVRILHTQHRSALAAAWMVGQLLSQRMASDRLQGATIKINVMATIN